MSSLHQAVALLADIAQPDGVSISFVNNTVQDPFNSSVYYDDQVLVVTGPTGAFSIEAHGETSLQAGDTSYRYADEFREAFPDGNLPEDGDPIPGSDDTYYYALTNWFEITVVPVDAAHVWRPLDRAHSTLRDAVIDAYELAAGTSRP